MVWIAMVFDTIEYENTYLGEFHATVPYSLHKTKVVDTRLHFAANEKVSYKFRFNKIEIILFIYA